jgi:hypothetical protein
MAEYPTIIREVPEKVITTDRKILTWTSSSSGPAYTKGQLVP